MGQIDNNGFIIKDDGTIVRKDTSSKINQMKTKLSTGGNGGQTTIGNNDRGSNIDSRDNNHSQNTEDSTILENICGWISLICIFGGTIIGAVSGYDEGGILGILVGGFLGFIVGAFIAGLIGTLLEWIVKLFK